jgi:hypothetical protein
MLRVVGQPFQADALYVRLESLTYLLPAKSAKSPCITPHHLHRLESGTVLSIATVLTITENGQWVLARVHDLALFTTEGNRETSYQLER